MTPDLFRFDEHGRTVFAKRDRNPGGDRRRLRSIAVDEKTVATLEIANHPPGLERQHLRVAAAHLPRNDLHLAVRVTSNQKGAGETQDCAVRQGDRKRGRVSFGERHARKRQQGVA
jgi:hypothetical protein